ncbi:RodZ domain-containing protein [Nocardiopsis sp. FIRDI 009]|uniref:RodZ domain-containing protein n=1 Tax=Nocardiopsis sp. FIRDI 009 TaxID=714197 RepID=UPI000E274E24|nr:RodZ domain-containing protein [Nocardiopsis sp. FIRDI 009]
MAIVGAVLLLVALVALGGYFLYRSLPSDGASVSANASGASSDGEEPENMGVLYVRVIGESSNVFVRIPGGDVLHDQVIRQGSSITYAEAPEGGLEVTIEDPSAVEVFVNGNQRDISDRSEGYTFTIDG